VGDDEPGEHVAGPTVRRELVEVQTVDEDAGQERGERRGQQQECERIPNRSSGHHGASCRPHAHAVESGGDALTVQLSDDGEQAL
jgi:hypothetical protein